jgi:hypothetical protein
MLSLIIFAGLLSPAFAVPEATITVSPNIINVSVGESFQVRIYITGLDPQNGIVYFRFIITWDNTLMQNTGQSVHLPTGWTHLIDWGITTDGPTTSYFTLEGYIGTGEPASDNNWYWETFTFRCLGVGSAPLNLPTTVTEQGGSTYTAFVNGVVEVYDLSFEKGAVSQIAPSPPSTPYHVGGEVFSANKLAVLSPYLALISVIVVAAVAVKRKPT